VFLLADRVTVLRDGTYVATKDVRDTDQDDLIHMMVGRVLDALFPKSEAKIGDIVLEARSIVRAPTTNDVGFKLREGEILGVAGLVGSGRTELAHVLFGVTPPDSGTLLLDGKEVSIGSPGEAKALGIAYVPEDRGRQGLIRAMPLLENISMSVLRRIAPRGFIDRLKEQKLAEESVRTFQIRASGIWQIAGKLSGGNQQKVVLSKWLATNPRILIMDEPTRGIDVGAKAEIHRLMSELAGKGMAILMISSELPEVLGMSDRILVMRGGRIVAEVERAEATQAGIAAAMMGDSERREAAPV
jgi:rhamnose transport system ATP-binding protein